MIFLVNTMNCIINAMIKIMAFPVVMQKKDAVIIIIQMINKLN